MRIGYYCDMLMFANLFGDKDLDNNFEEVVMSLSLKKFQTYAAHITNDL